MNRTQGDVEMLRQAQHDLPGVILNEVKNLKRPLRQAQDDVEMLRQVQHDLLGVILNAVKNLCESQRAGLRVTLRCFDRLSMTSLMSF